MGVGGTVGTEDGSVVGTPVGRAVGGTVGRPVGSGIGTADGYDVGIPVGTGDGTSAVGTGEGAPAQSFSYHRMKSFSVEARNTSASPSPSTSATSTKYSGLDTPGSCSLIKFLLKAGRPSFSSHTTLRRPSAVPEILAPAKTTSRRPSPFMSAARTEEAPKALSGGAPHSGSHVVVSFFSCKAHDDVPSST